MGNSPNTSSIHILDDDSLLNVFDFYQHLDDSNDEKTIILGEQDCVRDCYRRRWWYQLAHVCQRWRNLILGSSSYLDLSLVCTYGTPVADMLAHSLPLPLVISFFDDNRDITAEDEEAMILALKQRDRVRRVRVHVPDMQKFATAMEEEYPILEGLVMGPSQEDVDSIELMFPTTFQAPRLRHLILINFNLPMESRLLTTAVGLITSNLFMIHPSTYFQPNFLLHWLSLMPQLDMLTVNFSFPIPSHDMGQQVNHAPITTLVTRLRIFRLQCNRAYLEEVVHRITAPCLERLQIELLNELTLPLPCLLHFIDTATSLAFDSAEFIFSDDYVQVEMSLSDAEIHAIRIRVTCCHTDRQVPSVAQIFNTSGKVFASVEHLTLIRTWPSRRYNGNNRTEWRNILRSFSNVKTLCADDRIIGDLSHCLRLDSGEDPLELLPDLQELAFSGHGYAVNSDGFASFIDARHNVGRPVTITRPNAGRPVTIIRL